jgi:hypothetical protein
MALSEKDVLRPNYPEAASLSALAFSFENLLTTGADFTVIGLSAHLDLRALPDARWSHEAHSSTIFWPRPESSAPDPTAR